jgi:hypothetical protein
MNEEHFAL